MRKIIYAGILMSSLFSMPAYAGDIVSTPSTRDESTGFYVSGLVAYEAKSCIDVKDLRKKPGKLESILKECGKKVDKK